MIAAARRLAALYAAEGLSRLADAITAWRLERGLLTADELGAQERAWRAVQREAMRPPGWATKGGSA